MKAELVDVIRYISFFFLTWEIVKFFIMESFWESLKSDWFNTDTHVKFKTIKLITLLFEFFIIFLLFTSFRLDAFYIIIVSTVSLLILFPSIKSNKEFNTRIAIIRSARGIMVIIVLLRILIWKI